jgi:hypothetical protein
LGDPSPGNRALSETELDSALQLLVERAQYITGSTGAALALPQGGEMVCRASAGSSAPAIGARLQVRLGLTAESIARRQLLRCNNAESDPRVNLEACRALGIASIVVLPLLRRNGEVRGLFELFSDHPYAFEERDLIALERMADLTLTALDLAEQAPNPAPVPRREAARGDESLPETLLETLPGTPPEVLPETLLESLRALSEASHTPRSAASAEAMRGQEASAIAGGTKFGDELPPELSAVPSSAAAAPAAAVVPDAMLRVQKCEFCGFPVSEGRTLCLDCEKRDGKKPAERQLGEQEQGAASGIISTSASSLSLSSSLSPGQDEFVPAFLVNSASHQGSWLSNHVNLLALVVLILGILVAVVLLR